jgi:hypothetical protein
MEESQIEFHSEGEFILENQVKIRTRADFFVL